MAVTETLAANKVALAVAGLVVVGGGGTAAYVAMGGELPFLSNQEGMIDTVPEDVDFVLYVDPSVSDDPTTEELMDGFIDIAKDEADDYDGPDDYEEWRANITEDADSDLDLSKLDSVVVFGQYPDGDSASMAGSSDLEYAAVLVDSEWGEDEFMDTVENGTVYEEDEYEGYTVYVQRPEKDDKPDYTQNTDQPTWVGVIADGEYVVGTEDAVKDALDVDAGETPTFDGELRESYDATKDGYFKFAVTVPKPSDVSPASKAVLTDNQFGAFRNLSTISGSYYTNGDAIGMEMRFEAGTEDDADDLRAILEGTFALAEESMRTREMESLIDSTTFERDGTTVVVTFERPVEDILTAIEASIDSWSELSQFGSGFGGSTGGFDDSGGFNAVARVAAE